MFVIRYGVRRVASVHSILPRRRGALSAQITTLLFVIGRDRRRCHFLADGSKTG